MPLPSILASILGALGLHAGIKRAKAAEAKRLEEERLERERLERERLERERQEQERKARLAKRRRILVITGTVVLIATAIIVFLVLK